MKIEVIDLRKRFQEEKKEILNCIKSVLSKGNLVLTKEVQNFEEAICKFTGAKYCIGRGLYVGNPRAFHLTD